MISATVPAIREPYVVSVNTVLIFLCIGIGLFLLPVVRLGGLPIPTVIFLGVFAYPFDLDRRFFSIVACIGLYIAILSGIHFASGQFTVRDSLYFSIFVFYILIYIAVSGIFNVASGARFISFLKLAFLFEILLIVSQRSNLANINGLLSPYFALLSKHVANATIHHVVGFRPFGTFGNPTYAGFVLYIICRTIYVWEKKRLWLLIGFFAIVLTTARMALLALLVFESFVLFVQSKRATRVIIVLLLALLGTSSVYLLVFLYQRGVSLPFSVRLVAQSVLGTYSVLDDYSLTYRLSMLQWMRENSRLLSFGGIGSSEIPRYVDSELILRSLQFGVFGFLLTQFTWLSEALKRGSLNGLFLIYFTIVGSITNTIATNVFFVTYLMIYSRVLQLANERDAKEI